MTNNQFSNHTSSITAEACAWIAQLETGKLTPADIAAFREWMARSPVHRQEILRLARLSAEVNIIAEMAPFFKGAATLHCSVTNTRYLPNLFKGFRVVMASLLLIVLALSAYLVLHEPLPPLDPALVATAVGEHREVTLSDGTVIVLNTDTRAEIDYDRERRKVRLVKGEAHFKVAHNPTRPFIVYAGEKTVRAVGTAFSVVNLPEKLGVMVVEGKVEVAEVVVIYHELQKQSETKKETLQTKDARFQLTAGESITYADSISKKIIEKVPQREIQRRLSWQDGFLDFSDTPLSDVVDELSRYTSMNIEIIDPELNKIKFGGIFRIDDLHGFFDVIQSNFHINVRFLANGTVQLSSDENNSG